MNAQDRKILGSLDRRLAVVETNTSSTSKEVERLREVIDGKEDGGLKATVAVLSDQVEKLVAKKGGILAKLGTPSTRLLILIGMVLVSVVLLVYIGALDINALVGRLFDLGAASASASP